VRELADVACFVVVEQVLEALELVEDDQIRLERRQAGFGQQLADAVGEDVAAAARR
jgi:hypothetical protein